VRVERGDFMFVRTGQLAQVRDRGAWGTTREAARLAWA
jgi:hypothetical protein